MYDILLKNGELVDPSQGMHSVGSVAIQDGKIAVVGKGIGEAEAKTVFDMKGKIIVPGLIDIHCHPVDGFWGLGVPEEEIGLNTGVTLLCDAGSSGAANFDTLRKLVIERAKTDIFCFLNIATTGLVKMPEIMGKHDIDIDHSRRVIEANSDIIKGVKIRASQSLAEGLGIEGIEIAKKLAKDFGIPLMVHIGQTRKRAPFDKMDDFSRATVSLLEGGDILSHYLTWEPGGLILKDGTVYPEIEEAQKRGVVLDSCHGLNHFSFAVARHAIAHGLTPTVISTDMASIVLPVAQSLAVVMSKFLNMGVSIDKVIEMTTVNPAKALGEEQKRGSLKAEMSANITVMEVVRGDYLFGDGTGGESSSGKVLLEPRMVFKAGKVMPSYSHYHIPPLFSEL